MYILFFSTLYSILLATVALPSHNLLDGKVIAAAYWCEIVFYSPQDDDPGSERGVPEQGLNAQPHLRYLEGPHEAAIHHLDAQQQSELIGAGISSTNDIQKMSAFTLFWLLLSKMT